MSFDSDGNTELKKFSMVNPEAFSVENQWFFRQTNLYTQIKKRPL